MKGRPANPEALNELERRYDHPLRHGLDERFLARHGHAMHRKQKPHGPRLEALLDERDHLRVKISMANDSAHGDSAEVELLLKRLHELDKEIAVRWGKPEID